MNIKKICVIGLGYIGLPTAALLANRAYQVHGVDIDQKTVDIINEGKIHIIEPSLDTFVHSAVNSGNLIADIKPTYSDVFIIAVPTPFHDGFVPNIDYVISATKSIAPFIQEGNIVILESTSPVGTTNKVANVLSEEGVNINSIYIAHCPERVLPGKIMKELVENDRIIGGLNPESATVTASFYKTFVDGLVIKTDAKTAEMAKLTENSFRDVNIAFANELSILCDKFSIDIWELIELANRHPRVNILNPGAGVGGHCIAVDPWFIVDAGGEDAKLIKTARERNDYKAQWSIEKIKNEAILFEKENGREAIVSCMGLSFKPDIDDLRESPALYITRELIASGFNIIPVEPNLKEHEEFILKSSEEAIFESDIIVFLVGHTDFKTLNIVNKKVIDFCGIRK